MKKFFLIIVMINLISVCFASKPSILFIGSSTIYYWKDRLAKDFPNFTTFDEGIAGITYADLADHVNDYAKTYPTINNIVVYAGDNDIAIPFKSKYSVAYDFNQTIEKLHQVFPAVRIFVISIKPCPAILIRASTKTVKETNYLMKIYIDQLNSAAQRQGEKPYITYVDIFPYMLTESGYVNSSLFSMPLGIHLNDKGYQVWTHALSFYLEKMQK